MHSNCMQASMGEQTNALHPPGTLEGIWNPFQGLSGRGTPAIAALPPPLKAMEYQGSDANGLIAWRRLAIAVESP